MKKSTFQIKLSIFRKKRKLCNVFININIENFVNFFLKTFLLIFVKKLFSQFKIEFDEKNNIINAIV